MVSGLGSLVSRVRRRTTGPRGAPALDDVSFEVQQGDSFAIVGPNGAGKTTALKIVARISYPTSGRVRMRGRIGALLEVGSGIHPELSARENIHLYGQILGMGKDEVRRRFDEIVEFAELSHVLDRPVKMYSSGMQLRLGFAIASHLDPEIFVVDEALAVGDAGFQTKCIDRMTSLVREGRTLVFVSHTLPIVREICNRGILLDGGKVRAEGTANEIVDRYLEMVSGKIASRSNASDLIDILGSRVVSQRSGSAQISTNDPITIEVDLEAKEYCENAILGIAIKDGRMTSLINLTQLSTGNSTDLPAGRHKWTVKTGPIPLLPGSYETLIAIGSTTRTRNYMEPRIFGLLVVSDGPSNRKRDQLFVKDAGFGPICVDFDMKVENII